MIISFDRKFTFVAVPKTASQSIRRSLRPHLTQAAWEQSVYDDRRFFPVPALARIGHGHLKVSEIRPFLLPGMWEDMFSFAIVRNPYDRFLSFCTYRAGSEIAGSSDPAGFMKRLISDPRSRDDIFLQPQHCFLRDAEGDLAVSFVGRFERLQSDFETICEHLGLAPARLDRVNASSRGGPRSLFDRELAEMVLALYRDDFEAFGYGEDLPEGL